MDDIRLGYLNCLNETIYMLMKIEEELNEQEAKLYSSDSWDGIVSRWKTVGARMVIREIIEKLKEKRKEIKNEQRP